MMSVAEVGMRHLCEGDKVDSLKVFRAKKHIRCARLHFVPESYKGSPKLYQAINFEKVKN